MAYRTSSNYERSRVWQMDGLFCDDRLLATMCFVADIEIGVQFDAKETFCEMWESLNMHKIYV